MEALMALTAADLDAIRTVIREEKPVIPACGCGLTPSEQETLGDLVGAVDGLGVEEFRRNQEFIKELRDNTSHVKKTALSVSVGAVVTAVIAGLILLFQARTGG